MIDAELMQALKLANTRKMFYAFIPKGGGDGKLIVAKAKIPPNDVLQLKKDIAGGTPVTGSCFGPPDNMKFTVGKAVGGTMKNVIPKIVRRDAGLTIYVTVTIGLDLVEDAKTLDKADAKIPPPLPLPQIGMRPGDEVDQLMTLANILDSLVQIRGPFPDGAHFEVMMNFNKYEINEKEADTYRKSGQAAFARGVKVIQRVVSEAQDEYRDYRKTMKKGMFGSVATFLFDTFSVTDPGDEVARLTSRAQGDAEKALAAAGKNSFVEAAGLLVRADTGASQAHQLTLAYKNGLEKSAGTTVTVLEGVKMASKVTLAVGGAVVTGGSTVAFAGGMGITAAEDLAPALVGHKVDWGKFAFDMVLGAVLKKLGPGNEVEKAVLKKLGAKVGQQAAKEAFAKVTGGSAQAILKKSIETVQKKLAGKDVTYDDVIKESKTAAVSQIAIAVAMLLKK